VAAAEAGTTPHRRESPTTRFSAEAKDYAERVNARLILIDGPEFANLMIEHNCGVVEEQTFTLKQVDENLFGDL
jgi:restriction system protein